MLHPANSGLWRRGAVRVGSTEEMQHETLVFNVTPWSEREHTEASWWNLINNSECNETKHFRKQFQLASRKSQLQNDLYLTLIVPNAIRKYSNFLTNSHTNNLKFPFCTTWPLCLSTYIAFSSKYLYVSKRILSRNTSVLKLGGAGGKQQE